MVKAVRLCKKLFFLEKSKKQGKEAGTNFALLSSSRNVIEQLMETYSLRPIKILQFLAPWRTQKCLTEVQNILAFLAIYHLLAESCIQQMDFLICYSCSNCIFPAHF